MWKYITLYNPDRKIERKLRLDENGYQWFVFGEWQSLPARYDIQYIEAQISKYEIDIPLTIASPEEYEFALERIWELINIKNETPYEGNLIVGWANIIEKYEDEHYPIEEPSEEDKRIYVCTNRLTMTTLYRLIRTPHGPERHLVQFSDGKPVSSRKVSDPAVLKDWDKYMRDTAAGSVGIGEILDSQGELD